MPTLYFSTCHDELMHRPAKWVRRGWGRRKPTSIRRLELRHVRRARKVELMTIGDATR